MLFNRGVLSQGRSAKAAFGCNIGPTELVATLIDIPILGVLAIPNPTMESSYVVCRHRWPIFLAHCSSRLFFFSGSGAISLSRERPHKVAL